jgi:hypothetical protein
MHVILQRVIIREEEQAQDKSKHVYPFTVNAQSDITGKCLTLRHILFHTDLCLQSGIQNSYARRKLLRVIFCSLTFDPFE